MGWGKSISKWVIACATMGILVPIIVMVQWFAFAKGISTFEFYLWPSSIMFMPLDTPGTSRSTISFVFAIAVVENVTLYAAIGALIWLLTRVIKKTAGGGHF